jgi:hypothetical protein
MADWSLNNNLILNGYPYPSIDNDYEESLTLELPFSFSSTNCDPDYFGWKIDPLILNEYPYIHYDEITPPYHTCEFATFSLNPLDGFVGIGNGLEITVLLLRYISFGDILSFTLLDSDTNELFQDEIILTQEGEIASIIHTIPSTFTQTLGIGVYFINVTISRSAIEIGTSLSTSYQISALPVVNVKSISPTILAKPITIENNETTLTYEVTGEGIEQITNTFDIDGYSAAETLTSSELLAIVSTTQTSGLYSVSFNFTVTDPSFKLISFKYKFGMYNASTNVQYSIDSAVVQDGTYPMGGWVEYIAPTPVALSAGTHTIQVYNSPSYWYLFSTTTKPTVPGMSITSATVYAMEMVYSISTSGVTGDRTVTITLDDDIQIGLYPVSINSEMTSKDNDVFEFGSITGELLEISKPLPTRDSLVSISSTSGIKGSLQSVTIGFTNVINLEDDDEFVIQLLDDEDNLLYSDQIILDEESYLSLTLTINAIMLETLNSDTYQIKVFILRDVSQQFCFYEFHYTIFSQPQIVISNIIPNNVTKPISSDNSNTSISFDYEIIGDNIKEISNAFTIDEYTTTVPKLKNSELLIINSTTRSSYLSSASFNFTVSDLNFNLYSFKYRFEQYSTYTNPVIEYRIDTVPVKTGNVSIVGANNWVEYIASAPVVLTPGAHTIQIAISSGYCYLYSTTTKPTVPGMSITSATVYAMEMVYSIANSNINSVRTASIILDDNISPDVYPITFESDTIIDGYGQYLFNGTSNISNMLTVVKGLVTLGNIAMDVTARYVSLGVDNDIVITGMEDVEDGDILTITITYTTTIYYTFSVELEEGTTTYTHTILADVFNTTLPTTARTYTVTVELARGNYKDQKTLNYSVIAIPIISWSSTTPNVISLPALSPTLLSVAWSLTGAGATGVSSIEGNAVILGTQFVSENINTTSLSFNSIFTDVSTITPGRYGIDLTLTVIHNQYGTLELISNRTNMFTAIYPDVPGIGSVALNYPGRYVGAEVNIVTTANLFNIITGDQLLYELKNGSTILYSYTASLSNNISVNSHTIPASYFTSLSIGSCSIVVTSIRGGVHKDIMDKTYLVVKPPTLHFVSIDPNEVELPMDAPVALTSLWYINGDGVNKIQGEVGIIDTAYVENIDLTL